jgi:hypothetical protein
MFPILASDQAKPLDEGAARVKYTRMLNISRNVRYISVAKFHGVLLRQQRAIRRDPKLAMFSHIVLSERPNAPALTLDEIVAATRQTYSGPLQVGEDLMSFGISAHDVDVRSPR